MKAHLSPSHRFFLSGAFLLLASVGFGLPSAKGASSEFHFDFGQGGEARSGFLKVAPNQPYEASKGYGFLQQASATNQESSTSTTAPMTNGISTFAVDLPEGNYDVSMVFGNKGEATSTTIKAESRRLMIEKVETKPGQFVTNSFTVHVRRPTLRSGGAVGLKTGEPGSPDWDDRLSLEFNGSHPGVDALSITPATNALTIYIAGDSTVCDQDSEPWAGWGMILPRFFLPGTAVSNEARSGLALSSFESQKRLQKILTEMHPGDYLFIQFGHNDQKEPKNNPGAGPYTTYKDRLKKYIAAVREKGGIPVLVTSMERRNGKNWKDGRPEPTLADYAAAVRMVGEEDKVPVIDLNEMSVKFYSALGQKGSEKAFVFYPANTFPRQEKELADNTHFNTYGAYELAKCIVEGIKAKLPDLAKRLVPEASKPFDPSKPDSPESVAIPPSPSSAADEKPAGS